jgi:hypothetical protein
MTVGASASVDGFRLDRTLVGFGPIPKSVDQTDARNIDRRDQG